MARLLMKSEIAAPADRVWKTMSDHIDIDKYTPMITHCAIEGSGIGSKRVCDLADGGQFSETIIKLDEDAMSLTYKLDIGSLPVENFESSLSVRDQGNGNCLMEVETTFEPKGMLEADVIKIFEGAYNGIFLGLSGLYK